MNIDKDAETDDATAEPAAAVADNQVSSGNTDGAFEPGPSSPFNPDGSLKRSSAYQRWAAQIIPNEQAEAAKRRGGR